MSQDTANTGRKMQDISNQALPRSMKGRNVIESSPSSEQSQAEISDDSGDKINAFINIQLGDVHETQADDPQFDWRTQDPTQLPVIETDDLLGDPDELPAVDYEPKIPQPVILAQDVSQSKPLVKREDIKVHQRYLQFLRRLCDETGTDSIAPNVEHGLTRSLHRARSIKLDEDLSADKDLDIYGLTLVIHIWQVVYLRVHYGIFPDEPLAVGFGAYFLSAHEIAQDYCDVTLVRLRIAVQYWEKRLSDADSCGSWREEAWLRAIDMQILKGEREDKKIKKDMNKGSFQTFSN